MQLVEGVGEAGLVAPEQQLAEFKRAKLATVCLPLLSVKIPFFVFGFGVFLLRIKNKHMAVQTYAPPCLWYC